MVSTPMVSALTRTATEMLVILAVAGCSRKQTSDVKNRTPIADVPMPDSGTEVGSAPIAEGGSTLPVKTMCEKKLAPPKSGKVRDVPFSAIAAAIIPSFNADTKRARVVNRTIEGCHGLKAPAVWEDKYHEGTGIPASGSVLEWGRYDLMDGREAIWLGTGASSPEALQEERGLLALVRLSRDSIVVDAVGVWNNTLGADRTLETKIMGSNAVFVEPRHFSGTGDLDASDGMQVWHENEETGAFVLAGTYVTSGTVNFAFDLPRGRCDWFGSLTSTVTCAPDLVITQKIVWQKQTGEGTACASNAKPLETARVRVLHLIGDLLVEMSDAGAANPLADGPPKG